MVSEGSRRLGRDDWARAALDALAVEGPGGVAVERIATTLGVTKGSFYWHFSNRAELLEAALDLWELEGTVRVMERLDAIADPMARLRALFAESFGQREHGLAEASLAMHAATGMIAERLARVTRVRVEYVARILGELGTPPEDVQPRAVAIYAAYLGYFQLLRSAPELAPTPQESLQRIVTDLVLGRPGR